MSFELLKQMGQSCIRLIQLARFRLQVTTTFGNVNLNNKINGAIRQMD
jgi:hypothetical protein